MNINFHYFCIKTLAVTAGFAPNDAQTLATYSQFVDDFDKSYPMLFKSLPSFIQNSDLAKEIKIGPYRFWLFQPVPTGFPTWYDTALLSLPQNQTNIITPFHFIPPQTRLNQKPHTRLKWRVTPASRLQAGLAHELMDLACKGYRSEKSPGNLIRLAIVLHSFADTYAHQEFSGLSGWENTACLTKVTDNISGKNITQNYAPNVFTKLPGIGHAKVNCAPDDSWVTIEFRHRLKRTGDNFAVYKRNNTEEFLAASREIMDQMLSCLQMPSLESKAWETFAHKIYKGLLIPSQDPKLLAKHWQKIFPDINYSYDKHKILQQHVKMVPNDLNFHIENLPEYEKLNYQKYAEMPLYEAGNETFFHFNYWANYQRCFVKGLL